MQLLWGNKDEYILAVNYIVGLKQKIRNPRDFVY